jgi:hypothetical protein
VGEACAGTALALRGAFLYQPFDLMLGARRPPQALRCGLRILLAAVIALLRHRDRVSQRRMRRLHLPLKALEPALPLATGRHNRRRVNLPGEHDGTLSHVVGGA